MAALNKCWCLSLAAALLLGIYPTLQLGNNQTLLLRIYQDEMETATHWAVTLHCSIQLPRWSSSRPCFRISWSRANISLPAEHGDALEIRDDSVHDDDADKLPGRKSTLEDIKIQTDKSGSFLGNFSIRMDAELQGLSSQLEILRAEELVRGRYYCVVTCQEEFYTISCPVIDFQHQNHSFICSEKIISNFTQKQEELTTSTVTEPTHEDEGKKISSITGHPGTKRIEAHDDHNDHQNVALKSGSRSVNLSVAAGVLGCFAIIIIVVVLLRWNSKVTPEIYVQPYRRNMVLTREVAEPHQQPTSQTEPLLNSSSLRSVQGAGEAACRSTCDSMPSPSGSPHIQQTPRTFPDISSRHAASDVTGNDVFWLQSSRLPRELACGLFYHRARDNRSPQSHGNYGPAHFIPLSSKSRVYYSTLPSYDDAIAESDCKVNEFCHQSQRNLWEQRSSGNVERGHRLMPQIGNSQAYQHRSHHLLGQYHLPPPQYQSQERLSEDVLPGTSSRSQQSRAADTEDNSGISRPPSYASLDGDPSKQV